MRRRVPAAVETVPVLVAAAHVDRGGAGVAGVVVLGLEPSDVAGLTEDEPCPDGSDPEDVVDVRGPLGDCELDLLGQRLGLRVELGDVLGVLLRDQLPGARHRIGGVDLGQDLQRLAGGQTLGCPTR